MLRRSGDPRSARSARYAIDIADRNQARNDIEGAIDECLWNIVGIGNFHRLCSRHNWHLPLTCSETNPDHYV